MRSEFHYHACPLCYLHVPCSEMCDLEPDLKDGDKEFGAHVECKQCEEAPVIRWNSFPDTFPEQSDTEYLVTLQNHFIRIAYFYRDSKGKHWGEPGRAYANEWDEYVTHWMKMPRLPESEGNDE